MRYLIVLLIMLALTGCSTVKRRSDFMVVNEISCNPLKEIFEPKQLAKLDPWFLDQNTCGIVWENCHVRRDLIRSYAPKFSVNLSLIDPSGAWDSPLKIDKINVEHCVLNTDRGSTEVAEKCSDLFPEDQPTP